MAEDLDVKLVISAQNKAKAIINDLNRSIGGMGKGFSVAGAAATAASVAATAAAAGIAAVGAGLALVTVSGIKSAMSLEQNKVAFTTMLGSAEKAGAVLKDITKFAATTPFELPEIQNSARSLLAFQIEAEKLEPTLRAVGDVASGVGAPIGEIAELYGKAHVQGRLFGEDINQLTGRGIPIIGELAKQFGVAESEVKKLVEEGKVGFPELETAFNGMTSEGGMFFGMMEAQSKTAVGAISNIKDTFTQLSLAIVGVDPEGNIQEGGLFDRFKGILDKVLTVLNENRESITNFANVLGDKLGKALGFVLDIFGKVRTTMDNTLSRIQDAVKQWQNYEGAIGQVHDVANILVDFFKNQFKRAWDDLVEAIKPYIPQLQTLAKIIGVVVVGALVGLVVGITSVILIAVKLVAWILKMHTAFTNFKKNAIEVVGNALDTFGDTLGNAVGAIVNFAVNAAVAIDGFKQGVELKFNELITGAMEWGQHMLQNFAQGIRNGFAPIENAIGGAKAIFEKIKFSKNKDIPSEVWGYHMMQNFAGGIDEGNEEVVDALDETVKKAEERIKAFTETFAELKEKTKEAWREFVDSTKDAKKEYNKSIDDIRGKNKELKKSFEEDVANAVLDIRDNIKGLQDELGTSNASFDQKMADQFVDAENTIAESKKKINTELEKADADRDEEKIAELQANIAEQESFLTKHADLIKQLEGTIAEERRVRGLDEVERLMEQKAVEASILQTQIDQEQAILNTHAGTIQQYHNAIKEQRRVRGLDEIALLIENFEVEKSALQTQEDAALEIKQNAMKKARQAYKKHLKNIIQDTERTVGTMATEFDKIPANMGSALEALSNRLINAGSKIKGDQTTNNVNNSKTFSVTVNAGGGEGQNDLLARLGVLLKTI